MYKRTLNNSTKTNQSKNTSNNKESHDAWHPALLRLFTKKRRALKGDLTYITLDNMNHFQEDFQIEWLRDPYEDILNTFEI